ANASRSWRRPVAQQVRSLSRSGYSVGPATQQVRLLSSDREGTEGGVCRYLRLEQLPDGRNASSTAAPRAASLGNATHRARSRADCVGDVPVGHGVAVANPHGNLMQQT